MKERTLSRRDFLRHTSASLLYSLFLPAVLRGVGEAASFLHTGFVSDERSKLAQPKQLSSIPSRSIVYGTHPHENNLDAALKSAEMIGMPHSIVGYYAGGNKVFTQYPEVLHAMNRTIHMGKVPMLSWGEKLSLVNLPELAMQLSQIQGDFLWRPWYEMNGLWARGDARWYGQFTDTQFIDAWQEMREYFATHVPHAKFIFSPNATDVAPSFEKLFPGDDWVDVFGLDAYNKFSFDPLNIAHYATPNLTPQLTFGPDIATIQRIAPNIPWFLTEINAAENAEYLQEALQFAVQTGAAAWMIFEWNKGGTDAWDERDWQASLHPAMLAVLQRELQQPYYVLPKQKGIVGL